MNFLQDSNGNFSSFRVVWSLVVLTITFCWAMVSIETGKMAIWPLDGITTIALFVSPAAKTHVEK